MTGSVVTEPLFGPDPARGVTEVGSMPPLGSSLSSLSLAVTSTVTGVSSSVVSLSSVATGGSFTGVTSIKMVSSTQIAGSGVP